MKEYTEKSLKEFTKKDLENCPICKKRVNTSGDKSILCERIGEMEGKTILQKYHLNCL